MTPKNFIKPDIIIEEIEENNLKENHTMLNRKRKIGRRSNEEKLINNNNHEKYHDKYRYDNILNKIKHISIEPCFNFVNNIMKNTYKNNVSKKNPKFEHQLIKIDYNLIKDVKVDFNRYIAKQTMKSILTSKKCKKYTKYDDDHNQKRIEECLIDCNEEDRKKLELLLNMTYLEYLDFYCGKKTEYNDILNGLMTFEKYCESDEFKKKYSDSEEYKLCLKNYLYNYEEKLKSTKERKPRKKRNNNIFGNNNIKQNETLIQDKEIKSNSFVINK